MRLRRLALSIIFVCLPLTRPAGLPPVLKVRAHPAQGVPKAAPKPPNILLVIADDMAAGLMGVDGDPRGPTPYLDQLAQQGTRFDRAYCNSPVCTPSRQSLFTGRMPHAVGVTQLLTALPDSAVTLGDWLGDLGYRTAAFGKTHFNGPSHHGFQELADTLDWFKHTKRNPPKGGGRRAIWRPFFDPTPVWLNSECSPSGLPATAEEAGYFVDRAADFIQRDPERPFFLVVAFHEPHAPFVFPRDWPGRFSPDRFSVPQVSEEELKEQPSVFAGLDARQIQGVQAAYYSSMAWMDQNIGRLLERLDDSGRADDTIVLFVSDNGYLLGQHGRFEKNCFYEPSVRVPLIVRWPGKVAEGRCVTDPVELVDIVPTVLDLAGHPRPPVLHGLSLASTLKQGGAGPHRDVVVSEYLENEEAMAISGPYKLIIGSGKRRRRDGLDNGLPLSGPYVRLYHTRNDPMELHDLGTDPEHQEVVRRMKKALLGRLATTREGLEAVPTWLNDTEAILWCLIPRDRDLIDPRLTWLDRWLR